MIDIKELKTRYDEIRKNIADRYMNVDLDAILSLQDERYAVLQEVETLRAKRNENAAKMKGKIEQSLRVELIEEGKRIKSELQEKEERLSALDEAFMEKARTIPNYASPKAPVGKEDKDSLAIKFVGEPRKFNFKAKKRQLEFQPLASSRMACPEMQTESEILNSLSEIKTFSIQSGIDPEHPVLKLNTSNGQEVMTLVKMMPIDGKWTVVKINDSLVEGGENEIFLFFNSAQKQVHGKIGCNNYNSSLEFSPKKPALVKIGPGITTMMACPDLDLEQSLLKALSEVVSFKKFSDRKAILSNAGGEILIELAR